MFKYAALATVGAAVSLKPTAPGGFFTDEMIRQKFARADADNNGGMSLSELRKDYIFVLKELTTELDAVFEIYQETVENCDFGPGD